ncbi:MAG: FeoB-associated Cys-rich membrane protein [Oscillospiraceae bacterium]|nr:FeoB-associated Cys-rich membrane protein [Oscillospiraceae bacterium]
MQWISENFATVAVCALLAAIVVIIAARGIKARKNGASSCSCGCANCAMRGDCHK